MKSVKYASGKTPEDYKCSVCGATNCKLWRDTNTFCPDIYCAHCATTRNSCLNDRKITVSDIDENGKAFDEIIGRKTDQIAGLVPAVPDEEGVGYWGYTSVPQEGCDWWYKLPTLPPTQDSPHGEAEKQQLQCEKGSAETSA